ncbi:MAG: hypothetical protein GF405_02805 [Candidatus Eisenbacteria bacterium]|nr:hypothetical protein [Candidatus Eisenbacteria bacterium]
MPKGRPRRGSSAQRSLRLWIVAAAVVLVVALVVIELVSSGRLDGGLDVSLGGRPLSERAEELDGALAEALVRMGARGVSRDEERRIEEGDEWVHHTLEGALPAGYPLYRANIVLTETVRDAGGEVVRGSEGEPDYLGQSRLELRLGFGNRETHRITLRETEGEWPEARHEGPVVALIIDDFGHNHDETVESFLRLDAPITISVLPHTPYAGEIATAAYEAGKEVLVHIPMEPESYPDSDPGEGALLMSHTVHEIRRLVAEAADEVPHAIGANNHMGSALTKDRLRMRAVMWALERENLFYVDSMTTPESVGFLEAERAAIPTARNLMFIDTLLDEYGQVDVATRISDLETIARERGAAIGIGHPTPETLLELAALLPDLEERGVELVFVSELVE